MTDGVWIVRLCLPNLVYPCIKIDAKCSLIFDINESFPARLSEEELRFFGGYFADNLYVL